MSLVSKNKLFSEVKIFFSEMVHVTYIEIAIAAFICLMSVTTSLKCHRCDEKIGVFNDVCKDLNDLGSTEECDNEQVCYEDTNLYFNPHFVAFSSKVQKKRYCGPKFMNHGRPYLLGCFIEGDYLGDEAFSSTRVG